MAILSFTKAPLPPEIDPIIHSMNDNDQIIILDSDNQAFDLMKLSLIELTHTSQDEEGRAIWTGGKMQQPSCPVQATGEPPIIISFYTINTPYEQEVKHLINSCEKLGLEYVIEGVPSQGSWENNCAFKSHYVYEKWQKLQRPILWVDADAVILRQPTLLNGIDVDFAIHKVDRWQFASGTMFFNNSDIAGKLISEWKRLCENNPSTWDQDHIDRAWENTASTAALKTLWLPQSYTKIFDREIISGEDTLPVIEHHQASRRYKRIISDKPVTPAKNYSPSFRLARSTSRKFFLA